MFKLLIIEPWEFGTANGVGPFSVDLIKGVNNNWLIIFDVTIEYKGNQTKYLLGKTKQKDAHIDLSKDLFEKVLLELAMLSGLNEQNYINYDLDKFRGEFFTGKLDLCIT
jgi:hypothetical protein